jgi:hypothetical protein
MFKIIANPTFTCAVNLSVPGLDKPLAVQMTFRHKTTRGLNAWLDKSLTAEDEATYLDEVLEGWQGVAGPDDQPLAYSKAALAQLLDQYPSAGAEIVRAYHHQLRDARAKN